MHEEQKTFDMFWQKSADSIQRTFVLTQSMRTDDPWLKAVLEADRQGAETWEMYCFIHGLPTRNPGTWMPGEAAPLCGNTRCATLANHEWPEMWCRSKGAKWELRKAMECTKCADERARRCCIITRSEANTSRYMHCRLRWPG